MNYEEYSLKLDFQKGSRDPSRVFRGMAEYIDAFRLLDSNLIAPFQLDFQTHQELADIETGSIKAIVRRVLNCLDDDALKKGNWNQLIGTFLHRSKYSILDWCNNVEKIEDKTAIEDKANEISSMAAGTDLRHIPVYANFTPKALVISIQAVIQAGRHLTEKEGLVYSCNSDIIPVRVEEVFPQELIQNIIAPTDKQNRYQAVVVIKKPDYLGDSKWQFKLNKKAIYAHIKDEDWLRAFRNREFEIKPGDALRVIIEEQLGPEGTENNYEVVEVLGIVPGTTGTQLEIEPE